MRLSVVVPTFNRAGLLSLTVPALMRQVVRDPVTYEVVFVSNGSTDETAAVLAEAVSEHPGRLRFLHIPPTGGPAAPRNVGIRAATGDVVVILDDDVVPDPDLVQRHGEFHARHPERHHAALGEVYVPEHMASDPMSLFHSFPYDEVRGLDRLGYLHFWTCNVSVKRDFMLQAGMFDERFLNYEDIVCGHRLAAGGMHLHFLPEARGQHLHQVRPSGIPAKGLFYGRWLFACEQHIPDLALKRRFGILSPDLGPALFAWRLVKRMALRVLSNPLTDAVLRALGATASQRSRLTDLYYRMIFRRHVLAGYAQARQRARAGAGFPTDERRAEWVGDAPPGTTSRGSGPGTSPSAAGTRR
jgi:glycosyltransferase involved in cell wall biosynthesis